MDANALADVRIVVVGGSRSLSASLRRAGATCVSAPDVDSALAVAEDRAPDLCLVVGTDPALTERSITILLHDLRHTQVVVLATEPDEDDFIRAMGAGAAGYLLASAGPEGLVAGLGDVLAGMPAVPRRFMARLVHELDL